MRKRFEEVEHTADHAIRVYGITFQELLLNAALGMNRLMGHPSSAGVAVKREVDLEAPDAESLLVAWLSELAYLAESEMLLFNRFDFRSVSESRVRADAYGERAVRLEKLIKAVTFHNLRIERGGGRLTATVVFDV